jgi:UDP-GlcNAc:undecaprenyl-phosphate/decaprenyl-phosphate GlcNAc-1-phosphate transferase
MQTVVMIFFVALAVTAVSTPALRRFALRIGFLDMPEERKSHRSPVPLLGGVAILAGAVAALLISLPTLTISSRVIGVSLAVLIMAGTGIFDDRRDLSAWAKIGGQLLAVTVLIVFEVRVNLPLPEAVNYLISYLWVICVANAINFLDNMDGLCAGVSAVAAAFLVLISAMHGQVLVAALAASVFGACLGFLPYNFKPAEIYMGDAGSLFLGFLLAVLGILLRFPENINIVTWMVPVLVLGLPILDLGLVTASRMIRRVNPFTTAGQDHISHRLVILGLSDREAVLVLYIVAGAFGMLGVFVTQADIVEGAAIGFAAVVVATAAVFWLERTTGKRVSGLDPS